MNYRRLYIAIVLILLTISGIQYYFLRNIGNTQARTKAAFVDLMHANIDQAIAEIDYIDDAMKNNYTKDAVYRVAFLDSILYALTNDVRVYDTFLDHQSNGTYSGLTQFGHEMHSILNTMRGSLNHFPRRSDLEPSASLDSTQIEILVNMRDELHRIQQTFTKDLLLEADEALLVEKVVSIRQQIEGK
jgi:hypothetical protein